MAAIHHTGDINRSYALKCDALYASYQDIQPENYDRLQNELELQYDGPF